MTDPIEIPLLHSRETWLRGAYWLVMSTAVNGVVSVVVGFALIRTFGPRNLGLYSVATAVTSLAAVFATLRMETHLLTRLDRTGRDPTTFALVVRSAYVVFLPLATLAVVPMLLLTDGEGRLVGLLSIAEVAVAPLSFARVSLQVNMRQRAIFGASVAGRAIWAVAIAALVITDSATPSTVIASRVLSSIIEAVLLHRLAGLAMIKSLLARTETTAVFRTIKESLPLAAAGMTGEAYTRLDQPLVGAIRGAREVGLYAAGVRVVELVGVHGPIVQSVVSPSLVDLHRRNDRVRFEQTIRDGLLLTLVPGGLVVATAIVNARWIALTILGENFERSASMIQVLAVAEWVTFVGAAYGTALVAEDKRGTLVWANVAGLVVNVAINVVFVGRFGGVAAAWASVVGYAVASSAMMAGSPALRREFRSGILLLARCGLACLIGVLAGASVRWNTSLAVLAGCSAQLLAFAVLLPTDVGRGVRWFRGLGERSRIGSSPP